VDAWKTLESLGVPTGTIRPAPAALDRDAALRAAVDLADRSRPVPDELREPVVAWLRAWQHHWPASFAEVLGDAGPAALSRLAGVELDRNRYLKLRRIAIANLSGVL